MINNILFEAIRQYIESDERLSKVLYVTNWLDTTGHPRTVQGFKSKHDSEFEVIKHHCLHKLPNILFALMMPRDSALCDEDADNECGNLQCVRDEISKLATKIFTAELETALDCNFNRAMEDLQEHQVGMRQKAIEESEDFIDNQDEYMRSQCEAECSNDAFDIYDKICNGGN